MKSRGQVMFTDERTMLNKRITFFLKMQIVVRSFETVCSLGTYKSYPKTYKRYTAYVQSVYKVHSVLRVG